MGESFHLVVERVPKGLPWPASGETGASPEEWDKATQLANIALPLIPKDIDPGLDLTPISPILREHGIKLDTYPNGPLMVGYIDIAVPVGHGWPAFLIPANESIVGDYKTTSDFRYMKTPEELANSVQMMTYAKWAIGPTGLGSDQVRLLHIYARTKPPFSRSSIRNESAIVGINEIDTFWGKTLDTVKEMQQTASCGSPDDVEANGALNGHCEAYGGCPFRERCGITKESGIKGLFQIAKKPKTNQEPQVMSGSAIMEKIMAARAAAQGLTPSPAPVVATSTPVPAVVQAPAPVVVAEPAKTAAGPISGLMSKIDAQGKGRPGLGGSAATAYGKENGNPDAQGYCGTGEMGKTTVHSVGDLMKLAAGVVPPDAPARTQEVITTPGMAVVDPTTEFDNVGEEDAALPDASNVAESAATTPGAISLPQSTVQAAPVDGKPRRGRPSKEEMAQREAAESKKFQDAVDAEVAKRTGGNQTQYIAQERDQLWESERVKLQTALDHERKQANEWLAQLTDLKKNVGGVLPALQDQGCTLYIDCFPTKGEREGLVDFFEWIGPIASAVAQGNGVADYRLIQYNSKGLLATHIRELVKAEGLPKAMTIPSFAAGADIALEVITPLAKRVIRKL